MVNYCGYVLENKIIQKCSTDYFFLERESGLSYIKLNANTNEVTYRENVIVNNEKGDYQASIRSREKVEAIIIALDTLLSLIEDKVLFTTQSSSAIIKQ